MKTQYDNYPICHVSREVRDYLRESDKELKRQQDQDYQYGVFFHAFDVEERVRGIRATPPVIRSTRWAR